MNTAQKGENLEREKCPLCNGEKYKYSTHCRQCSYVAGHPWRDSKDKARTLAKIGAANKIAVKAYYSRLGLQPRIDAFHKSYEKITESGCWIWMKCERNRYGVLSINDKLRYAHRFSYELHRGPIEEGMTIDHLCFVRQCVNPDHLEVVTLVENTRRGLKRRWHG